jgi:hypothetical protein
MLVFVRPNSSYVLRKLKVIEQMSCQVKYLFAALMSKLANHIALFCSHDNTGYLVKFIDPVLGLDQN